MRACSHRSERTKVNVDYFVILCVGIRQNLCPIFFSALCLKKCKCDFVRREDRGCCAKLCAHICDCCTLGNGKCFNTLAAVFDYFANAALNAHSSEHFKNDIFCRNPRLQIACEVDSRHLRHRDIICAAAHCNSNIKTACTHCKHADTAACRCVAVRAD